MERTASGRQHNGECGVVAMSGVGFVIDDRGLA
jgi:hypothetical protein